MQRAIFGFAKAIDRVKIPDLPNRGTRLDNLEIGTKPSIGRVALGHVQGARRKACAQKPRALDLGVINIRPARRTASIFGGCHHD